MNFELNIYQVYTKEYVLASIVASNIYLHVYILFPTPTCVDHVIELQMITYMHFCTYFLQKSHIFNTYFLQIIALILRKLILYVSNNFY